MIELPKCVSRLSDLCPSGGRFPAGVNFIATGSGYRLCATDGRIMGIVSGPVQPPGGEACLTIPKESWAEAFKLLDKTGLVRVDDEAGLLRVDHKAQVGFVPVDGRFPAYLDALPKTLPLARFIVDPSLLISLLRVAAAISETTGEKAKVEFLFYKPGAPIGLVCRGAGEICFDGVIMPMS